MKKQWIAVLLFTVLATGCTRTVTRQELDESINEHMTETISWVSYAGTKDEYHYIIHSYKLGSDRFRIHESELEIENPFPLTWNKNAWRPLKKHWENWERQIVPFDWPIDDNILVVNPADLHAQHQQQVVQKINRYFKRPINRQGVTARVRFVINRDGTISNIGIIESTGNGVWDQSAIKALKDAARVPPLDDTYKRNYLEVVLTFYYFDEE